MVIAVSSHARTRGEMDVKRDDAKEDEMRVRLAKCRDLRISMPYGIQCEASTISKYPHLQDFLDDNFSGVELPDLRQLTVDHLERALEPSNFLWACLHHFTLTVLNLENCDLSTLYQDLQFWSVSSLEVLNLNYTMLQWLPASVGRLKELRKLSLNGNSLKTLPHTLSFCTKLEELNLEENNFYCLPGFIVLFSQLKSLRRYGNPRLHSAASDLASSRWRGFISTHHEGMGRRNTGVQQSEELGRVTPLAILAVQSIMVSKMDYWSSSGSIAPAVCRTLDLAQMDYRICDHCYTARHEKIKGWKVYVLLEAYLGLHYVPFDHYACSARCAKVLEERFTKVQRKLREEKDSQYKDMVEQYTEQEKDASVSRKKVRRGKRKPLLVTETWQFDVNTMSSNSQSNRRKCAIL